MIVSRVAGENPVSRQTWTPASDSRVIVSTAPGSALTWPAATASAYRSSNTSLACQAVASSPRICRNTSIFDWPMVACTVRIASAYAGVSSAGPNRASAAENAASTLPSSAIVVPAMSRQAIVMLLMNPLPDGTCLPRWPGRRSSPAPRAR